MCTIGRGLQIQTCGFETRLLVLRLSTEYNSPDPDPVARCADLSRSGKLNRRLLMNAIYNVH
jgi:hypothetical protein